MPGIEEEDISVLLGEDENLSRDGSTSQGKQSVGRLAEAGGTLIGRRLGRGNQPRSFFKSLPTSTASFPLIVTIHGARKRRYSAEVRLFPLYLSNLTRPTRTTEAKFPVVGRESPREKQTVPAEKDPG